jgi:hypothetical protein
MGLFGSSGFDFGPLNEKDNSLSFKKTPMRCFLVLGMAKLLKPWRPSYGSVSFVTPGLVLKSGPCVRLAEALTVDFLAKNTSIPVPRIFAAFEDSKTRTRYILMSRLKGTPLNEAWDKMPEKTRVNVLAQLRAYMSEVRAVAPPRPGHVGSFDYTPLWDDRIFGSSYGPFTSPEEFHLAARAGQTEEDVKAGRWHASDEELTQLLLEHSRREYSIHLTHGDLCFRNIMVHEDKISGIFDWELAGWYPDYWEYTNAWYSFWDRPHWRPYIDEYLEPRPRELGMEQLRRKLFRKSFLKL